MAKWIRKIYNFINDNNNLEPSNVDEVAAFLFHLSVEGNLILSQSSDSTSPSNSSDIYINKVQNQIVLIFVVLLFMVAKSMSILLPDMSLVSFRTSFTLRVLVLVTPKRGSIESTRSGGCTNIVGQALAVPVPGDPQHIRKAHELSPFQQPTFWELVID